VRKILIIISMVGLAVAALDVGAASAGLTVCINASSGSLRAVGSATKCRQNESSEQLATEAEVAGLRARVAALESLLQGLSRNGTTLRLSGLNLQVVNGTGHTDNLNGLGNVIIGYNADQGDTRKGSHNLVIGDDHTYTSYSGVVSGEDNTLSAPRAFVAGGFANTASGNEAFVGGGAESTASGLRAFVGGGDGNTASGGGSAVVGGHNTASGDSSFVGGGVGNNARGDRAFVGGGFDNAANSHEVFVGGGAENTASGLRAFVGGGDGNTASGLNAFVGGGDHAIAGPGTCAYVVNILIGAC
jgi:hypothetical protein